MKMQKWSLVLGACLVSLVFAGCPNSSTPVKTNDQSDMKNAPAGVSSTPAGMSGTSTQVAKPDKRSFVPASKRLKPLPSGVETVKFKKGQDDLMLYLHPKGILSTKPLPGKKGQWKSTYIPVKRGKSWFIKLDPDEGSELGTYTSISLIMAVYNAPGGYATTSRFSIRFLLRRNGAEKELFRTMVLARGQQYKYYGVDNREIATRTKIQKGDVLVFRVMHRTGSTGAVGVGGVKQAELGPRFMISTRNIGNFYQYTK